ncbi:MAG: HAD family hydrolase [Bacteroidetes bacterium]|nr:HAD family hydrolase [Bacteroidota bacterium]
MRTEVLIFDWGDTIMIDFCLPGPMIEWDRIEWVPGAETALQKVSMKYFCCIASNAPASDTQGMISALRVVDADQYFQYFITSKEIGAEKPDLKFFKTVCEQIGFPPEKCLMIGDKYEKDIVGAKKSGMKTVLFNKAGLQQPFPLADAVITDMAELPEVIERL